MKNGFYMDMISKSLISSLSDEIAGNITKEIKGYIEEAVEKSMPGHTAAIDASIKEMKQELSAAGETRAIVESSGQEIKDHISEMAKVLSANNDQDAMLKDELNSLKQALLESSTKQDDMLKGAIENSQTGLSDQIGEFIEEMKIGLNGTVETKKIMVDSNKEIKTYIKDMGIGLRSGNNLSEELKDELAGLKKTLTENKKEEKELLNGVYYSVKKLLGDNGGEKALTQFKSAMADIKKQMKEHTEKQLRIENNSQDKIAGEFHDNINDLKKYIDEKIERSFKEHGQKNVVHKELTEIKKAMDKNERGQAKLLNGVSDSVKKLTSARSKGKEGSANMMAQLHDMLDALNGHVRLLTSDKDKLSLELMRRVGDDFFQDKFAELEKELEKTKSLADKYLSEKTELTGKLEAFQHLWEQAAAKKA